jgi:hypothetical protein
MHGEGVENLVTTGKIKGKRDIKKTKSWMVCADG